MTDYDFLAMVYWFDANDLMLFFFQVITVDDTNVFFTFSVTGLK